MPELVETAPEIETTPMDRSVASLLESVGIKQENSLVTPTDENPPIEEVVEEVKVEEETKEETKEEKKEKRDLSKKFRKLNKEREAFEKEKSEVLNLKASIKLDPIKFLQDNGITIQDWAKAQLETPDKKAIRELEKYKTEQAEKEKAREAQLAAQEASVYQEKLVGVIKSEFTTNKDQDYSNINALISEGILNDTFFSEIADQVQTEFNETGVKPDLHKIFGEQEKQLQRLYDVLSKQRSVKTTRLVADKGKPAPAATNTLSNRATQVVEAPTAENDPNKIKALVMEKYGIGKSYGMV